MNKLFTAMMLGAVTMTCLEATAYEAPTPENPLVIWSAADNNGGENWNTGSWNKLAIDKKTNENLRTFLTTEPDPAYQYYIQVLDANGKMSTNGIQIGTNYGSFNENGEYTEVSNSDVNTSYSGPYDGNWGERWFNTWQHQDSDLTGTNGLLITNHMVYQLNRHPKEKISRNLQINGDNQTISKVQIVAVPAPPKPVEMKKNIVFTFNRNGVLTDGGKYDPTIDFEEVKGTFIDSDNKYWNSDDCNHSLTLTAKLLEGLNLEAGDQIKFNYTWWQSDSYATVYLKNETNDVLQTLNNKDVCFEITSDNITKIKEKGIYIKAKYINIDEIFHLTPKDPNEEPEDDGLIDIFIPGKYPAKTYEWDAKDYFGYMLDGENPAQDMIHFGTGVINPNEPTKPYGYETHAVYSFFDEWWDKDKYNDDKDGQDYGNLKNSRQMIFDIAFGRKNVDSWPLMLQTSRIPNMSRIKLGDQIIINFTTRTRNESRKNTNKEYERDLNLISQFQVGTFDPDKMNPNDPHAGMTAITTSENNGAGQPSDMWVYDNENEHELTFTVTPELLDYITRYGLTFNGRLYDLNWVKAKVADKTGVETDKQKYEYFYNITHKNIDNQFSNKHLVEVTFEDDIKYNETITHYYDNAKVHKKRDFLRPVYKKSQDRDYLCG